MATAAKRRTTKPNPTPNLAAMHDCIESLRDATDRLLVTHPHHAHELYVALHHATLAVGAMRAES